MIVADTNLLVQLLLPGEHTRRAEEILRKEPGWTMPLFWRSEFCNVLATFHRKKIVTFADARDAMLHALELLAGKEFEIDHLRVLELAALSECSAYDCEFIALAQALDCQLVTSDRKIRAKFPGRAVSPEDFLNA